MTTICKRMILLNESRRDVGSLRDLEICWDFDGIFEVDGMNAA